MSYDLAIIIYGVVVLAIGIALRIGIEGDNRK